MRRSAYKAPRQRAASRVALPLALCCVCNTEGEVGRAVVPLATREWVHRLDCWPKLIATRAAKREAA